MTVNELNRDQLIQLKQNLLMERMGAKGEWPSWGEIADADSLISDEDIYDEFSGIEFSKDDFWL